MSLRERRQLVVLPSACFVWALSGCGGPSDVIMLAMGGAGPQKGGVVVAFAPTATSFADQQALLASAADGSAFPLLRLWIDGRLAMLDDGAGHVSAATAPEGGVSGLGYLEAGPHHFALTTAGGVAVFAGDAEVPDGGTLRLFLFGPAGAQRGRFVATPDLPAAGNEHLTVLNLIQPDQSIEVVRCRDTAPCAPLSPALALGELFDTEIPVGPDVGYRVVPSASLPDPPVVPFDRGSRTAAPVLVAAPVYVSVQGQLQFGFQ
jgi:hypothetical protein